MKGVVFTEFLEMVETKFGYDMVDHILNQSDLESGGIYTAVGTYDHKEMFTLLRHLSEKAQIGIPDLLHVYGRYLFRYFVANYSDFFTHQTNSFDFLESIETHIHVEVKKLYPDAELPRFVTNRPDNQTLIMIYHSNRKMADFAEGLISECMEFFGEPCDIQKEPLDEAGEQVRFRLTKRE